MTETTPTQQVMDWLAALGAALERGDADGAAGLFDADGYWRDLVAFTWNIVTAEGSADVRRMIEQAVIPAGPAPRMSTDAPFGSPSSLMGPLNVEA